MSVHVKSIRTVHVPVYNLAAPLCKTLCTGQWGSNNVMETAFQMWFDRYNLHYPIQQKSCIFQGLKNMSYE